jgi:hypothetical protein
MYFIVSTQENTPSLHSLREEIQGQNIHVKFFNCELGCN